jgi:hypothetical protein
MFHVKLFAGAAFAGPAFLAIGYGDCLLDWFAGFDLSLDIMFEGFG